MATLNSKTKTNTTNGVLKTETGAATFNHEGGIAYVRDNKSELFVTAVSSLNEDTFYEKADERAKRLESLVVAVNDPDWVLPFVKYLRTDAGLRTVPLMIAVMAAKHYKSNRRQIINAAIGRLDEAPQVIAFWHKLYGKSIPSAVKRGVNDALKRLLNEKSYLKWRGKTGDVTLRDVINLTHPNNIPLAGLIIDEAYKNNKVDINDFKIIKARKEFLELPNKEAKIEALLNTNVIRNAALTHEVVASAIGKIPAQVWEVLVPNMGLHAIRMNLRNIEESGPSKKLVQLINDKLQNKEDILASNQLPLGYFTAYKNAGLKFAAALQEGLSITLENIQKLPGKTVILVDKSGSMGDMISYNSTVTLQETANVFAAALALKSENVILYAYDFSLQRVNVDTKDLMRLADKLPSSSGGTYTHDCVTQAYEENEDATRFIVITDEQASSYWRDAPNADVFSSVPNSIPCYTWNLGGYATAHTNSEKKRYTFAGLNDKAFGNIEALEAGHRESWPWEVKN